MKRSETVGNSRKRSETVGNMIRPKLVQPAFFLKSAFPRNAVFIFWRSKGVQGETVGNSRRSHLRSAKKTCFYTIFKHVSWTYATKQLLFCRAKVRSLTVSNRFPLDTFGPSKKKTALRGNTYFKKNAGWTSFGLIMFPTVSDRFRPFHFFWTINWTTSIMEGWSSANPCKPWRLSFLVPPLCAYTAPNIASWPWYPIFPKNHKIPGAREI